MIEAMEKRAVNIKEHAEDADYFAVKCESCGDEGNGDTARAAAENAYGLGHRVIRDLTSRTFLFCRECA